MTRCPMPFHKGGSLDCLGRRRTFGAMGILSAVYYRGLTGEGQALTIRNAGSYERLHDYALHWGYPTRGPQLSLRTSIRPCGSTGFYPTKDGGVFLGGLAIGDWKALWISSVNMMSGGADSGRPWRPS